MPSPTHRLGSATVDAKETPASGVGLEPGLAFGTRLRLSQKLSFTESWKGKFRPMGQRAAWGPDDGRVAAMTVPDRHVQGEFPRQSARKWTSVPFAQTSPTIGGGGGG